MNIFKCLLSQRKVDFSRMGFINKRRNLSFLDTIIPQGEGGLLSEGFCVWHFLGRFIFYAGLHYIRFVVK